MRHRSLLFLGLLFVLHAILECGVPVFWNRYVGTELHLLLLLLLLSLPAPPFSHKAPSVGLALAVLDIATSDKLERPAGTAAVAAAAAAAAVATARKGH